MKPTQSFAREPRPECGFGRFLPLHPGRAVRLYPRLVDEHSGVAGPLFSTIIFFSRGFPPSDLPKISFYPLSPFPFPFGAVFVQKLAPWRACIFFTLSPFAENPCMVSFPRSLVLDDPPPLAYNSLF